MSDPVRLILERKGNQVFTVGPMESVERAVARMNDRRIGALVVLDGKTLVGVFSERDVLVRVVGAGLDPRTTVVRDVMTCDPITIYTDTTVDRAMAIVTEYRCRHLPVVDQSGVCGMVSSGDFTSWLVFRQRQTIEDLEGYIRAS